MPSALAHPRSASRPHVWPTTAAWYGLLASVAIVPLTTTITRGALGGTYALTDDAYFLPKLIVLGVLIGCSTASWIIDLTLNGRPIRSGPAHAALAVFAALVCASTAFAAEPVSSLFGVRGLMTGAITWLLCGWMAFLIGQYLTRGKHLRQLSWAFVAGCGGVALIALLQALGLDPLSTPVSAGQNWMVAQGSSTLGNPDYTGMLLVAPCVLGLAMGFVSPTSLARWCAWLVAALMALAVFITLTRAAWLGLVAGAVTLVLISASDRRVRLRRLGLLGAATAGAALLGTVVATPTAVLGRFSDLAEGINAFSKGRLTLWGDAVRIIAKHPLLGTGADGLALGGYQVQRSLIIEGNARYMLQDPHNLPLLLSGVFGVPAFLALLAAVALAFRSSLAAIGHGGESAPSRTVLMGWVAGAAGMLVASLLSVWTINAVFVLFLTIGVLASPGLRPARSARVLPAVACATTGLVLIAAATYGSVANVRASRHLVLANIGDTQLHLQAAMDATPWDASTRVDYYFRKINALRGTLAGADVLQSRAVTSEIDTELRLEMNRFPEELQFHRLRIYLYDAARGYPGYQPDAHLGAVEDALRAFPGDPEFAPLRESLLQAQGS